MHERNAVKAERRAGNARGEGGVGLGVNPLSTPARVALAKLTPRVRIREIVRVSNAEKRYANFVLSLFSFRFPLRASGDPLSLIFTNYSAARSRRRVRASAPFRVALCASKLFFRRGPAGLPPR